MIRLLQIAVVAGLAALAVAAEDSAPAHDNVDKNHLAVQGYDVVSYFTGNEAAKGKKDITAEHHGHTYRFASQANRDLFKADPDKYIPAYGGWCATAVAIKAKKVEIDPTSFKIVGGRLMLFYKGLIGDAKKDWNEGDEDDLVKQADENWKKMTSDSSDSE